MAACRPACDWWWHHPHESLRYCHTRETTGWALELDSEIEVTKGMEKVKNIEVDPNGKSIEMLKGKRNIISSLSLTPRPACW